MGLQTKTTSELIKIASAGAGFKLNAKTKTTSELIKIASAAASGNAQVTFVGLNTKTTSELIKIGSAGKGNIVIED